MTPRTRTAHRPKPRNRWWLSWVQTTEDVRPLTDPPNENILGWWCSGYDAEDSIAARIQNLLSTKYTNTQKIVAGIIDQELRAVERAV